MKRKAGPRETEEILPEQEENPAENEETKPKKPKISASVRRKRQNRRSNGKPANPAPHGRQRDFSNDLEDYLQRWERREAEGSNWKFNKVLQAWAIANCTRDDKVPVKVFKKLLPYLNSVHGGARDRLKETLRSVIEKKGDAGEEEDAEEAEVDEAERIRRQLKQLQRAGKILELLEG